MSTLGPTVRKQEGAGVPLWLSPRERRGGGGPGGGWACFTPSYLLTASAEQLMGALSALPPPRLGVGVLSILPQHPGGTDCSFSLQDAP